MRRMFIQLACVVVLLCMLTNISGLFLVFCYQQQQLKQEMKQYLNRHPQHAAITILSIADQDQTSLKWENDDEFFLRGQMYDVIKKVRHGDKMIFYCMPDAKESTLIKNFLLHNENNTLPVKGKASVLAEWLSCPYVLTERAIAFPFMSSMLLHYARYIFHLPYIVQPIVTPPPRFRSVDLV